MPPLKDLSGQTFGRLTVLERGPSLITPSGQQKTRYWCECSCEKHTKILVMATHLKDGHVQSCGCLNSELSSKRLLERKEGIGTKHGKSDSHIYNSYCGMIDRCYKDHHQSYIERYQNRGIDICEEWYNPNDKGINIEKFREFYNWSMMNDVGPDKSIDRIDNNGPYAPWNCRWATDIEQMNNIEGNRYIYFNDDKCTIGELANITGINYDTLYSKIADPRSSAYTSYANNAMVPVQTLYGPIYMFTNFWGTPYPMNAIYFIDKYGHPINQNDYKDPQPTPALWATDDKGFITGPMV